MAGAGYLLFTAGQVLTAAQVNTYLMQQSIMVFSTSAARDSALSAVKSEGMPTYQLDNNDLDIYNGSSFSTLIGNAHGALTTWTPAVVQSGAVTTTNNASTYQRVGRMIIGSFLVTVTGSGTGANIITVSTPVTAAFTTSTPAVGPGWLFDTSASAFYSATIALNSSTVFRMYGINPTGAYSQANMTHGTGASANMSAGLAVGDILSGSFAFEAAADA